jgi:hypothetical protein
MLENFITRRDCYGKWINNGWISVKNELTDDEIKRHEQGLITIGSYSISQDNTCNFVCWDIDNHGEGSEPNAAANQKTAFAICEQLEAYGLYGLIEDSDGRGSFHVWLLFDKPIPSKTAYDLGCFIKNKFNVREAFPKQSKITENTPFGNLIRLPGKHHKHNHFSNFWIGEEWGELDKITLSQEKDIPDFILPGQDGATADRPRPPESKDTDWLRKYDGDFKTLDIVALCQDRYIGEGSGNHKIVCPWADSHSDGKEEAFIWDATESRIPAFYCHHSHCSGKSIKDLLEVYPDANGRCSKLFSKVLNLTKENLTKEKDKPITKVKMVLPPIVDVFNFVETYIAEPETLIEGLLHKGSKLSLGGGSKGFKTWTLFNMGYCVAYGLPWLGKETQKSRVLYVNFEIPEFFSQSRLKVLNQYLGITQQKNHYDIWNLRGYSASYVDIFPLITKHIKEHAGEYGLIILDPIYKLYGDTDENKAGDVAKLCNEMEFIIKETGAAIGQANHYSKGNQASKEAIDRISGSGVWSRDPDSIFTFTSHKEENCYTVESTLRNFAPVAPFVCQ